tara:strand:+ start:549 stop:650 length:102 start_codon:yes stop_codon:yes gene_type:complete
VVQILKEGKEKLEIERIEKQGDEKIKEHGVVEN